ncbi:MAG: L,D-transpeptidase [Rubrivivax sp.]|nr:MAG: L,D-transpeptidase [Rubrivivax sp.]
MTPPAAPRPVASASAPTPAPLIERRLDLGSERAPADVTGVATWAVREADNGDRPFAIVDKRRAKVYVFAASGRLLGASPVLLGYAAGDQTVEGIGNKAIADIKPHERTTPAGRFQSEPGRNSLGHDVVWVDYDAAVSMHRVRATNPKERRLERLATPTAADNRISWGCINVPVAFFDETVWPNIGQKRGIVYVLPEKQSLVAFFPAAATPQLLAQASTLKSNNAKP